MDKENDSCLSYTILVLAVAVMFFGLAVCIYSFVHCIELDFTEEQRNVCETQKTYIGLAGFLFIVISILCFVYKLGISKFVGNIFRSGK